MSVDYKKLEKHIKLCMRNLKSERVICCGTCPFEGIIVDRYPEMRELFKAKRKVRK